MRKFIVSSNENGKKLNIVLQGRFNGISNSLFYKTLRKKDIRINGKRVSDNVCVNENDEVAVYLTDEFLFKQINYKIIFEDENILVVTKPAGICVVGENNEFSLTTLLQEKYGSGSFPYPCHRIDTNTSGIVLFAKNEQSLSILFEKFKEKQIEKHYACIVCGILENKKANLQAYLWKDSKKGIVYVSKTQVKGSSLIITNYKVIKENLTKKLSLLDVEIPTGKTHQIRAHLAYIGYPILGDSKYGNFDMNKKYNLNVQQLCIYKLKF